MGLGSLYPYSYKMLIDDDFFYQHHEPEVSEEDEESVTDSEVYIFDEDAWEMFKDDIMSAFDAYHPSGNKWIDRDVQVIAETDRAKICIDSGGGSPCLFLKPKTYTPPGNASPFGYWVEKDEKEYILTRDAKKGFNRLIKQYPGVFRYATTAWTSEPYKSRYE